MQTDIQKILDDIRQTSEGKYLDDCLSGLSDEGKKWAADQIAFWWSAGIAVPWGMIKREATTK